jgi:hypothetical protein
VISFECGTAKQAADSLAHLRRVLAAKTEVVGA